MNPQAPPHVPAAAVGPALNELMQAFQTALLAIRDTNQSIQQIRVAGDQTFAHFEAARAETGARWIELANLIRQQAQHVLNQEGNTRSPWCGCWVCWLSSPSRSISPVVLLLIPQRT